MVSQCINQQHSLLVRLGLLLPLDYRSFVPHLLGTLFISLGLFACLASLFVCLSDVNLCGC